MTRPASCDCYAHDGFLTVRGIEDAQRRLELPEVDATESSLYLDSTGSVSGLELERDMFVHSDAYIDSQYRRFRNGL